MITNVPMSNIDMYTCTAMNILGKVNASLQLIVRCKFSFILDYIYTYLQAKQKQRGYTIKKCKATQKPQLL